MKRIKHNDGYIFIKAPQNWPGKIYSKIYCFEHHLVYFQHTGIIPNDREIIHHRDGDKQNNTIENLELMPRDKHSSLHKKMKVWGIFKCPCCGTFYLKSYFDAKMLEKKHKPSFCSRSCSGKMTWNGKPEHLIYERCYLDKIKM